MSKVIFEKSVKGRRAYSLPLPDTDSTYAIPAKYLRQTPADLPELSEPDVIRHFTELSAKNHGVDTGFYPLGSCTMKYNPAVNEDIAKYAGFADTHPFTAPEYTQGNLQIMYDTSAMLSEITGMDNFSLQPAAGAHGELAGLMIIKAYFQSRNEHGRTKILIPDTAHGTNPASAAMAGFEIVQIKSDADGNVNIKDLQAHADNTTAGLMLTNPSTLGLFETNISQIADIIHGAGGLLYYDGANLNAILGITRPGDMGFDVIHLNLHKTFSTPHGGGGPGSGPIGVKHFLDNYLPYPTIERADGQFTLNYDRPLSIGKMRSFHGNFAVIVRAYAYILSMGTALSEVAENAVLNANYLMSKLRPLLPPAYDRTCMHEFVSTAAAQKDAGSSALDIAKRLLDFSVHPPTIYFPLIIKEAMMFEPTETESKQTLDFFAEVISRIISEVSSDPVALKSAPHSTPVGRLDDTLAARKPVLYWTD